MVTDHSEYMGVLPKTQDPENKVLYETDVAKLLRSDDPEDREKGLITIVGSLTGSLDRIPEFVQPEVSKSVWQEIVQIADENYEPGKFTTFPAYEWTSQGPKGTQNLHRNIIFRSSDAVPELPSSSFDSVQPEDLWDFMDGLREQGVTLLAIPHNPNLSDGLMFPMVDSESKPLSKAYAEQRMRNEPIAEATQIKGTSETNPLLSDTDKFANFEIADFKIDPASNFESGQAKGSYIRDAYKTGLVFEERTDANPYKFGMTGATDTHNSGAPIEEDNYFGKLALEDGTPQARLQSQSALNKILRTWGASGLAAVWAQENTRESIYNAMARKESFSTTGPRIRVRLFGAWDSPPPMPRAGSS